MLPDSSEMDCNILQEADTVCSTSLLLLVHPYSGSFGTVMSSPEHLLGTLAKLNALRGDKIAP